MRKRTEASRDEHHGLCAYTVEPLSCPLPGVYSAPGARSAWYCWLHHEQRPQGPGAREDLQGIIERQHELRQGHYGASALEQKTLDFMRQHPEWYRQPGETSSDYRQRMVGTLRGYLGRVTTKLPYDRSTQLAADEAAEERAAIQTEDDGS